MGQTSIAWTEQTWNPVRGCSRISEGCRNCYAERMAARSLPGMNSPTTGDPFAIMTPSGPRWTGKVELIPHMLAVPLKRRKPTTWFVNSMSDLFHESLSNEDIRRVFQVICECRGRHTFQILTKRAERMADWFDWALTVERGWFDDAGILDLWNTWVGVSVENQQAKSRIEYLRYSGASHRFLSLEPLIEDLGALDLTGIQWVIVGGESGPGARAFNIVWARSIVEQCKAAGVACFVKQLGAMPMYPPETILHPPRSRVIRLKDRKGGDPSEWPADLRVQEMPEAPRG